MDHNESLLELMTKPRLIGLENIDYVSRNTLLFDGKKIIGEIDLIYHRADCGITVVEYKRSNKMHKKAMKQLDLAYHFIEQHYSVLPDKLFVWKDKNKYLVEQV